jgi:hypothetical protein
VSDRFPHGRIVVDNHDRLTFAGTLRSARMCLHGLFPYRY